MRHTQEISHHAHVGIWDLERGRGSEEGRTQEGLPPMSLLELWEGTLQAPAPLCVDEKFLCIP